MTNTQTQSTVKVKLEVPEARLQGMLVGISRAAPHTGTSSTAMTSRRAPPTMTSGRRKFANPKDYYHPAQLIPFIGGSPSSLPSLRMAMGRNIVSTGPLSSRVFR